MRSDDYNVFLTAALFNLRSNTSRGKEINCGVFLSLDDNVFIIDYI